MPLSGSVPLHAPLAEQAVAPEEDHTRVDVPPNAIVVGLAVMVIVGAGVGNTVTLAEATTGYELLAMQDSSYVEVPTAEGVTLMLPLAGSSPLQAPLAVQAEKIPGSPQDSVKL